MVETPKEESPVGAMPKTADEKDDEGVAEDFALRDTATAEGDIDIVAEPGGEGDVPTAPEFGDVATEIGYVEIATQLKTKEFGTAYGTIAIAREIAVDLDSKEEGSQPKRGGAGLSEIVPNRVDIPTTTVGDDHFLEESPEDLPDPVEGLRRTKTASRLELRQEIGSTLDRPRDELGEKAYKSQKFDEVACGGNLMPVDIDGIAQRLEGIETDADREYEMEQEAVGNEKREPFGQRRKEEIVVLKEEKDADVDDDVGGDDYFCLIAFVFNQQATQPAAKRGEENQKEKFPVPTGIKEIGSQQKKEVLSAPASPQNKPIDEEHYRQEKGIFQ